MTISKLVKARMSFHGSIERADASIDDYGLPSWLAKLEANAASALAIASVGPEASREVLGLMLAFRTAFGCAPPPPARELGRARKSLKGAVEIVRTLPKEIDNELMTLVELAPSPEGFPVFDVFDPVADARHAMSAVATARPQKASKPAGRPVSPISLAVIELVRVARSRQPSIERAALTKLVTEILGAVLISVNEGRPQDEQVPEPRWGERVRAALAELGDEVVAIEQPVATAPFQAVN